MIDQLKFANSECNSLTVTIDGVEWHGIKCNVVGAEVLVESDGEIANLVQAWLAEGNQPEQCAERGLTSVDYEHAIRKHLDAVAQSRRYDNAISLALHTSSSIPAWAAEAAAFVSWRDAAWLYAHEQLAAVQAGQRTPPSPADFIGELPPIVWP